MDQNYQSKKIRWNPNTRISMHIRVLLIEDDYSYAELVKIFLADDTELIQCEVTNAESLETGLTYLQSEQQFDVVLLDLSLPDSQGIDTLHRILHTAPNANIIVLTGGADPNQGIAAVSAGAQDFLIKGDFDPKQLMKALRFSMERQHIIARLEETQRLAKIGHWELCPAQQYFDAANEVYHFFGLDPIKDQSSFEDLGLSSPFYLLRKHELENIQEDKLSYTLQWTQEDGVSFYAQVNSRRVKTSDGHDLYIGSLQDISLQKRAEELEQSKKMAEETARVREQVLANVSHELRTPMNAILGLSNVINRGNLDEQQNECIDNIQEASQVLLSIINDLLLSSSLQNEELDLELAPFNVHKTIRQLSEILRPKAISKGLKLEYQIDNGLLPLYIGDKQRLSQVLYNIVGNAIKFTEEGQVEIRVSKEQLEEAKDYLVFEIEDTGLGISEDQYEEIFLPFSRIKKENKSIEGTGLGLSIVKQLIDQMEGTISVRSALEQGTIFTFKLPFQGLKEASVEPTSSTKQEAELAQAEIQLKLKSILVVEDHKMNQLVIRRTLEKQWPELKIHIVDSGEKALELIAEVEVDLVLMDLQLPGIDGCQTTTLLRQMLPAASKMPILAMTAQPKVAEDDQYIAAGMNDYILKPFDPKELFKKIAFYLSE